jgi:hypothetical protein
MMDCKPIDNEINHEKYCNDILEKANDLYEKIITKENSKENKLAEIAVKDNCVFLKIRDSFNLLNILIKYCIVKEKEYYDSIINDFTLEEFIDSKINFPNDYADIIKLYFTYPNAIEFIKNDLKELVNIENYKGLLILSNLSPLLYYSAINTKEISDKVEFFEDDYKDLLNVCIKILTKISTKGIKN